MRCYDSNLTGLAFPNFYLYYLASQLVHIHDWLYPVSTNACDTTEGAIASSLETLYNIIYRGCVPAYPGTLILRTSLSLFQSIVAKICEDLRSTSPNNPLGFNPNLQELYSLPDPQQWSSKQVKYVCHLYTAQGFKSFYQLRVDLDLPRTYPFYYYQLRHAVRGQFGSLDDPI